MLLSSSKDMCNIHKQDWTIRTACTSGQLSCTRPPRGLTLSRKQDWHGLLGWGLFIQDHAATPSFTVGLLTHVTGHMLRAVANSTDVTVGVPTAEAMQREDPAERLKKLQELKEGGLITGEEFAEKKAEILQSV